MKLRITLLPILVCCLFSISVSGQQKSFFRMKDEGFGGKDLQKIEEELNAYYATHSKGSGSGWKLYNRWLNDMKNRTDGGKVFNFAAMNYNAIKNAQQMARTEAPTSFGGQWFNLPVSNVDGSLFTLIGIGRINCLAFHPTNANTIFAGSPAGGLWKTTDGGGFWECISYGIAALGISAIAIHPTNPNIIYVMTGDADAGHVPSIGVLKSIDGGLNWTETDLQFTRESLTFGRELKINAINPNLLLAATDEGIYRTTNGGADWTLECSGNFHDIEFKPGSTTECYASSRGSIWKSDDGGDTWAALPLLAYFPSKPTDTTRVKLAITPADPNYVYALFVGSGGYKGVYRSTSSGLSFSRRSFSPDITSYSPVGDPAAGNQAGYDLAFAVSPVDPLTLYVGGINIWKSIDGGSNWTRQTWYAEPAGSDYVHADIHALETRGTGEVFAGCDGGVWKSNDGAATWSFISNSLNVTQFYEFDGTDADQYLFYGGAQDLGTQKFVPGTIQQIDCCDGAKSMIDYTNSNIVYVTGWGGNFTWIQKSTNGSSDIVRTDVTPYYGCACPDTVGGYNINGFAMNPVDPDTIYAVFRDFYKSPNGGATWTRSSTGDNFFHVSIAISPSNPNVIYIASGISVRRSTNGGGTWSAPLSISLGGANITDIAVSDTNPFLFWVTQGGYAASKVLRCAIPGTSTIGTVTNVSGSLPNVPVNTIAYHNGSNNGIYVGTDIGVFYRDDNLNRWIPFNNGLPNVRVEDLKLNYAAGVITAATFGMGLWQSGYYTGCPVFVSHMPGFLATPIYGAEYFEASDSIRAGRSIYGGAGTSVTYNSGGYVRMVPGFEVKAGTTVRAYIEGCTVGTKPEGSGTSTQPVNKQDAILTSPRGRKL